MAFVPLQSVPQLGVTARDHPVRPLVVSSQPSPNVCLKLREADSSHPLCTLSSCNTLDVRRKTPEGLRALSARGHQLKEHQGRPGKALERPPPRGPGAIEAQGFLRGQREERLLGGGTARRGKCPGVDVRHLARLSIIPTAIFGEDHIIQDRASLLPVAPEQDLALGAAGRSREVVAMQGHTALAVGGPGKERMGALLREPLLGRAPALRGPQALDRDGREALRRAPALRRGRIIGRDESVMALFQVARGRG